MSAKSLFEIRFIRSPEGGFKHYLLMSGVPCILASLWADELSGNSNTVQSYLRDVAIAYEWANSQGERLEDKLERLTLFPLKEISSLAERLCRKSDGTPVSQSTCIRRLEAIRTFVKFAFDYHIELKRLSLQEQAQAEKNRDTLFSKLKKKILHNAIQAEPPRYSTELDEENTYKLFDAAHPASPDNPFRSPEIRFRNYCILHVLLETLARRGEAVLIELDDVSLNHRPTILIKTPSATNKEKRNDGASLKTRGRKIPISTELSKLLSEYISDHREKLLFPSRPCTALFVSSRDGRRLSSRTLNLILRALENTSTLATVDERIHPHGMRATAANRARKILEQGSKSKKEIADYLAYLGGWAPGSNMVQRYTRRSISERVSELIRPHAGSKILGEFGDEET